MTPPIRFRARPSSPLRPPSWAEVVRCGQLSRLVTERRRENNFDLLRLFAALLVLFAHSFDLVHRLEPLTHTSWGDVGVLIFFSISGFLVCRSWDYDPRLGQFAAKRALRLLPGLIVAMLFTALVLGPIVSTESPGAYFSDPATKAYVLDNVTLQTDFGLPSVFLHNIYPGAVNGSLWTLPIEVKAYLLLAILGLVAAVSRIRVAFVVLFVALAVYTVIAMFPSGRMWLPLGAHYTAFLTNLQMPAATVAGAKSTALTGDYTIYTVYLAAFAMGAALYVLRRLVLITWPLALIAFAISVYVMEWRTGNLILYVLVFTIPYLALWIAYRTHGFLRLPRWFGDYSYGIYIYAFPAQQTASQLLNTHSGWVIFAVSLVPTVAAAVLSWHFVERPMLRLKTIVGGSTADQAVPAVNPG